MEFHLPFYVWKVTDKPNHDSREGATDKARLRKSIDLSFLDINGKHKGGEVAWLHQAQVSCLVMGPNNTNWTALCCADTYFDGDDGDDSVESVQVQKEAGYYGDPLLRGHWDADKPIWDPRQYFLILLCTRINQVLIEWNELVTKIKEKIEQHVSLLPCSGFIYIHLQHGPLFNR